MKEALKILTLTLLLVMMTACGTKKVDDDDKNNNIPEPIDEVVDNETVLKQGEIELSNVKITSLGSINTVTATVKNTGAKTKTFDAVLYMKNDQNQILGKVSAHVDQLSSSKTKDISVEIMGDYTTVKTFELIIENLSEK